MYDIEANKTVKSEDEKMSCKVLTFFICNILFRFVFTLCELIYGATAKDNATCDFGVKPSVWLLISGIFGVLECIFLVKGIISGAFENGRCSMFYFIIIFELVWFIVGIVTLSSCYYAGPSSIHTLLAISVCKMLHSIY